LEVLYGRGKTSIYARGHELHRRQNYQDLKSCKQEVESLHVRSLQALVTATCGVDMLPRYISPARGLQGGFYRTIVRICTSPLGLPGLGFFLVRCQASWHCCRLQKAFVMVAAADHILSGGKECSIESLDARAQASLESLTGMKQLQIHLN
jgi:hypothetical protein